MDEYMKSIDYNCVKSTKEKCHSKNKRGRKKRMLLFLISFGHYHEVVAWVYLPCEVI